MNGSFLTLGLAGLAALAGARRGARQAPVPTSVIEEAKADAKTFLEDFSTWREKFHDESSYDLFWGRLLRVFGDRLLGSGVQRFVLASADPRYVIKLTHFPTYNLDEAKVWQDAGPETRKMLVPVAAVDPAGHWLIMERVEPSWGMRSAPSFKKLQRQLGGLGFLDVEDHNISADGRLYDYAEAVDVKGSPARRGARSVTRPHFTLSVSPLTYRTSGPRIRTALVDEAAPPPGPKETYFVPTQTKTSRGRKEDLPGAEPGVVAFCDHHLLSDGGIYIDFYTTRRDLRRQGYGQALIDELYRRYADAPYIDWGLVASDEALRSMRRMQAKIQAPRTYGKLW